MTSLLRNKTAPAMPESVLSRERVMPVLIRLHAYVLRHDYEGADLFDGLNSWLFRVTPLYQAPFFRLALIQFCKQSPVDFRKLFLTPPGFNPKGGALFLMGTLNWWRLTRQEALAQEARRLFQRLRDVAIVRPAGHAWGYNFDWQARAFYVPKGMPNLVTSVYVGRSLLDYARTFEDPDALCLATGVVDFIQAEMIQFEDEGTLCFNYIPGRDAQVHNANLLGAAYLATLLPYLPPDRQSRIREQIAKSVTFSANDIRPTGAWPYGTKPFHRWVDHFHTAYNIEALLDIKAQVPMPELDGVVARVVDYYLGRLFTPDGLPRYYDKQLYPLDVHVLAEAIVVLNRLRGEGFLMEAARLHTIEQALWGQVHQFQDRKGYFYYQRHRWGWNKIPYMRWGQAWMFYALSTCLEVASHSGGVHSPEHDRQSLEDELYIQ